VQGFRTLEERVGKKLVDLAEGSEEKRVTFADTQVAPVPVITSGDGIRVLDMTVGRRHAGGAYARATRTAARAAGTLPMRP